MLKQRVLIIDDETGSRQGLTELVANWGYETEAAADGAEGLEKVASFHPHVVLADLVMPRMDGMELLRALSGSLGHMTFVMLTAKGSIASAVEAMKQGAFDYLAKPVDTRQLQALLEKATSRSSLWEELERYENVLEATGRFGRLVGKSTPMRRLYQMIKQAGLSSASVLVPSIVPRSPNLSWKVKYLGMKKGPIREQRGDAEDASSSQTAARCSLTKLRKWRLQPR